MTVGDESQILCLLSVEIGRFQKRLGGKTIYLLHSRAAWMCKWANDLPYENDIAPLTFQLAGLNATFGAHYADYLSIPTTYLHQKRAEEIRAWTQIVQLLRF